MDESHDLKFEFDRETKNTYRYAEGGDEDEQVVGTLYVQKAAFPKGKPETLRVQITIADEGSDAA